MIKVDESDLLDLIYYARRYCDKRTTYAPTEFNRIYEKIRLAYPELLSSKDQFNHTLKDEGKHWPYAQDGHYNENTGNFNALPKIKS